MQKVKQKLQSQILSLTLTTGSVRGGNAAQARELYTLVVRSAIAYGASAFHTPTAPGGPPRGPVRRLVTYQNRSLRCAAGAYRATPARLLESELGCPPLDLYLTKRAHDFEVRAHSTGFTQRLRTTVNAALCRVRNTQGPTRWTPPWHEAWAHEATSAEAVRIEWDRRFRNTAPTPHRTLGVPAAELAPPTYRITKRHKQLHRHQSSPADTNPN